MYVFMRTGNCLGVGLDEQQLYPITSDISYDVALIQSGNVSVNY